MKNHMIEKLENPNRIIELAPTQTLHKIGISEGDTVCDIGTGTGIFALAAAKLTNGIVYAVDINADLLKYLDEKAVSAGLKNVKTLLANGLKYDIDDGIVNLVLLSCVLHEIENKTALFTEIKRILKRCGKLCVIEFKKETTAMGPPLSMRICAGEVNEICADFRFSETQRFELCENMYAIIFTKE